MCVRTCRWKGVLAAALFAVNQCLVVLVIRSAQEDSAEPCGWAETRPAGGLVVREIQDTEKLHVQNVQYGDTDDDVDWQAWDGHREEASSDGSETGKGRVVTTQTMENQADGRSAHVMKWAGFDPAESAKLRKSLLDKTQVKTHLYTSKKNVPLHSNLTFFEADLTIKVMRGTFKYFPQTVEFPEKPYRTCSVVGNGGVLFASGCGNEIDSADHVFRLNLPPVRGRFTADVGTKTNFVTVNPSVLEDRFELLQGIDNEFKFVRALEAYPAGTVIYTHPFHVVRYRKPVYRINQLVGKNGMQHAVRWSHPDYMRTVGRFWRQEHHLAEKRITSGLLVTTIALSMCEQTHLYGFWPFRTAPDGRNLNYHYFKRPISTDSQLIWDEQQKFQLGILQNKHHDMVEEFHMLQKLHDKGVLRLHTTGCEKL